MIIIKVIKRIIFSCFLLYFFNYFSIKFDIIIPINFFTFILVFFLDYFALSGLVIFKYLFLI
ncbi:MAG: pro-sigmaK processing inhibitor BofA family protein [Bacilli bacterium]|nr:pro-sigmaK processing inhibitor BofA family protein [Bacilli bacterium]